MSKGRPRQDVFFLTIAVGVLVVAVALFIGVRSLSPAAKPAAKAKDKTGTAADPKTKDAPKRGAKPNAKIDWQKEPLAPGTRDPFGQTGALPVPGRPSTREAAPARAGQAPARAGRVGADPTVSAVREPSPTSDMRLVGITRGTSGGATVASIETPEASYQVQVGEHVGEFTVAQIGANFVVLQQGTVKSTLTIRGEAKERGRSRSTSRPARRR
jgi:hypothetical protein